MSKENFDALMREIDKDGSGEIQFSEWLLECWWWGTHAIPLPSRPTPMHRPVSKTMATHKVDTKHVITKKKGGGFMPF